MLDALDRQDLWADTAVVLCTDHGHYLGEKDIWGKPGVPIYEPLGHIPLLIAWPGRPAGVVDALTTSVDLFATLCDVFDVTPGHRTHGSSLVPLLTGEATAVRDWALTGVWGREVHVIDGHRKYARSRRSRATSRCRCGRTAGRRCPSTRSPSCACPAPTAERGSTFMPGSDVPVIRQPFAVGDTAAVLGGAGGSTGSTCSTTSTTIPTRPGTWPAPRVEAELEEMLRHALGEVEAPRDQYERLGL